MSVLDELGPPEPGAEGDAVDLRPPSAPKPPTQQASPVPEPQPKPDAPPPSPTVTEPDAEAAVSEPEPEVVPPEPTQPDVVEPEVTEPSEPAADVGPDTPASALGPEPEPAVEDAASTPEETVEEPAPAEEEVSPEAEDADPPQEPDTQSAALTPNDEGAPSLRIEFEDESSELPGGAGAGLAEVVGLLSENENRRLVIYAYADGAGKTESQARRLSLSRALAVRRYLVENGIRGTRAEIRALGQKAEDGPIDRVDLVVIER